MKQKLNAKDFILIGILTALMWIICMIISTIMSVAGPVTNVFYPSVMAIPNGIVMMLLLAKVPKKGVFTICAAIQAILFLLVGAFWFLPINGEKQYCPGVHSGNAQYHFCSHAGSHCCCWTGGRPDWRIYRPESIEKAFHQGWTRFCKITRTAP